MTGPLWKVTVVTVNNGDVTQDYHYFITEDEAVAFYEACNREYMQYALSPIKIR